MSRATTTAALALAVQIAVSVTLEIMGPGAVVGIAQSAATGPAQDASRIPNVVLTTQDGARVRFYDDLIKGKFVLVNFMFTTCTSVCPRATENLSKVAAALGDRLERDVRIISVTVDPRRDTPAVLKKYASRFGTGPGWYFVTGQEKDIDVIRNRLGADRDGNDKSNHTGMVVYGNERTGQWAATPVAASPKAILRSVDGLLAAR
jgi:protein SCO1/2